MSLDSFTDTQVAALLMLATGAANADHAATAGEDVVVGVVGAPFEPGMLGMTKLPALFVYRQNQAGKEESQFDLNTTSTFIVDYWAPLTPLERIPLRWPLLKKVWLSIAKAFQGGMHPDVSNGAQVLRQAGLRAEVGGGRVDYSRGLSEGGVYPFFRAAFRFYEEGADDVGVTVVHGLSPFLEAYSQWLLPDATPTSPTIEQTISLEGYPRALVVGLSDAGLPIYLNLGGSLDGTFLEVPHV